MGHKGQSLVELAISLVFLMFLLSGAIEFGIIFFQYVQLRDAAQEGALYGSICPNDSASIAKRALAASEQPIHLETDPNVDVNVSLFDSVGNPKPFGTAIESDGLRVQVSYRHHIFMPFMPKLIGRTDVVLNGVVTDTILTTRCR